MSISPNEVRLLAFDPGGKTGWAAFKLDCHAFSRPENKILANLKKYSSGALTGTEHEQLTRISYMLQRMEWGSMPFRPTCKVVSEDFDLVQTIGGKELLSPVRINAVIHWLCAQRGISFELQARQLRKGVTKERLNLFGFTGTYQKDEFAAMQHGITYLRRLKQASLKNPWKLTDSQSTNAHWDCSCARGSTTHDLVHPL